MKKYGDIPNERIEEGNKLIELFHSGREIIPNTFPIKFGRKQGMPKCYENYYDITILPNLRYNTSWEMLMPVIITISTTISPINIFSSHRQNCVHFYKLGVIGSDNKLLEKWDTGTELIELAWIAVVEFIERHNVGEKYFVVEGGIKK